MAENGQQTSETTIEEQVDPSLFPQQLMHLLTVRRGIDAKLVLQRDELKRLMKDPGIVDTKNAIQTLRKERNKIDKEIATTHNALGNHLKDNKTHEGTFTLTLDDFK